MIDFQNFSEEEVFQVIKLYLIEAKSQRFIQKNVLNIEAPNRGGGYVAMQILHRYGIHGDKKGVLSKNSFEDEYSKAEGPYKLALEIIKENLN